MRMNQAEILRAGCGRYLTFLGRAGETMTILLSVADSLPYEYAVHIQAKAQIILNGALLTSTDEIDDDRPYGECDYDRKVYGLLFCGVKYTVRSIEIDESFCIRLLFDNGLEIFSCPIGLECSPQDELWRIFLLWFAGSYLIGYFDHTLTEETEESQETLDAMKRNAELRRKKRESDKRDSMREPG